MNVILDDLNLYAGIPGMGSLFVLVSGTSVISAWRSLDDCEDGRNLGMSECGNLLGSG